MNDRPAKNRGLAKAAAYHSAETRTRVSVAAKAYGVKTQSVYCAAKRCGLSLPHVRKMGVRP